MVGFSQGGCLAGILAALKERGDSSAPLPALKTAVVISGFAPVDPSFCETVRGAGVIRGVKMVHVYGKRDFNKVQHASPRLKRTCLPETCTAPRRGCE